mmetsp:Transcript_16956/g.41665  ORF Transcript_16956/g.41665 Transcript_16956/m.41665 type:complete len:281 (-) Transcript_16956:266-1108(-)|eukprot:CAMPEP_0114524446 /NCGR_PEP_ID=MMETSP0109-20121206/21860_1 /TAXON_ID=29199 /ORGANISM="Chlorarachnion reptans, Strain CCCM449" /LENGTH=280 /DNA_ID=CAMNT_0001705891 /DNA_START=188 /DNA_END=1030 /DNA_ORIENTATION=+
MSKDKLESMTGYLDKQSPKFPFPWQRRFFEVQLNPNPVLLYFQKPGDVAPKGTISAENIADVTMESRRGRKTRIIISLTSTARKYYLRASTPESCQSWYNCIRQLMEMTEEKEGANGALNEKVVETKENLEIMKTIHKNLIDCLRVCSKILQGKPSFQKFAMHVEHQSYFELGAYAPIFSTYFRAVCAFRNANFEVHLKLDDVSSVDLECLKFEGFLDEAARTPFLPKITAARMEEMLKAASMKSIEKLKRYIKEAENVKDDDVVAGLTQIVYLFRCLID